ncbi:hypothetical protein SUGI_0618300 [Cryptomeria japonica]|uniref:L-tryptophan--pyruvate aminotransferase 1 n=1 Tax=Cryptomeria japonica TaxID=3369 RepID=UPI002414AEF7|nr:L-tryptophan--pyruvate aminotransferase 1 [Cryptomeria japonica]XP_059063336.1 L-tryptophan--pyruvate aminotransferase 1 [Cryptomeria japonica]GLJ30972.1 hypothetical protein SUGI_0618300 [Cryptomeria japonica]
MSERGEWASSMAGSASSMRCRQKQQGNTTSPKQKQESNSLSKQKQKQKQKQKGKPMPGSMNSKYLISLSMAVNVFLLTSLVYEKNYHTHPLVNAVAGHSLVDKIRLRQQGAEADADADAETDRYLLSPYATAQPAYKCHACLTGHNCSTVVSNCIINLDHGDPTMFESFWINKGQESTTVILGWQLMSYFADTENICWFLEPELAKAIRSLHDLVGNAVTKRRTLVIGTGSTQLFQAALYALSQPGRSKPTDVVSAAPYYSSYPVVTDYLKSDMYRWAGDAWNYKQIVNEDHYIELVTSPNNPDGFVREAVVNGSGPVVYDHAYYWPHYTPIIAPADGDVMLFTVSKSTGHAGTRIGWAIVKDAEVAKKMTKYIELNTIGVSKDSQLRASKILHSISNSYASEVDTEEYSSTVEETRFFHHGSNLMAERWRRLRDVVSLNHRFSLPAFQSQFCNFFGRQATPQPAFAWVKCEGRDDEEDCAKLLRSHGIITRSGRHFGAPQNYVRLSILDRNHTFNLLIDRLSAIH